MPDVVDYMADGGVATITLNSPEHMNTMNASLLQQTLAALRTAAADDAVRAVILTGTGRVFCAGGDLGAIGGPRGGGGAEGQRAARDPGAPRPAVPTVPTVEHAIAGLRHSMTTSELLHGMPKVTFAAINGACAGAGLAWACACDIRYCAESAMFNTAFMTAGLSGDFGGTWTLPRIVGAGKARELYLLAEKFGGAEAGRIGLVSGVFPDDELMTFVREKAQRVAGFAPLTLRTIKETLNDSLESSWLDQLDREADRHTRMGRTEDAREAARAFLEKRPPVFKGR